MDHQGLFVQRAGAGVQVGVGRTEHAQTAQMYLEYQDQLLEEVQ